MTDLTRRSVVAGLLASTAVVALPAEPVLRLPRVMGGD